jgi:hypothetical protein
MRETDNTGKMHDLLSVFLITLNSGVICVLLSCLYSRGFPLRRLVQTKHYTVLCRSIIWKILAVCPRYVPMHNVSTASSSDKRLQPAGKNNAYTPFTLTVAPLAHVAPLKMRTS